MVFMFASYFAAPQPYAANGEASNYAHCEWFREERTTWAIQHRINTCFLW